MTVRVLLVEGDSRLRAQLLRLLEEETALHVAGHTDDASEALSLLRRTDPDVVVLDHGLEGTSSIALCRTLTAASPVPVVMLTSTLPDEVLHACLGAGARACLLKSDALSDLPHTLQAVARGKVVFTQEATNHMLQWANGMPKHGKTLTPDELQILSLVADGKSNREIGEAVHVSQHTVKSHLRLVMRKLDARNRAEAVAAAVKRGLL